MCGIAGIQRRPDATLSPDMLARLGAALAHRGPDGAGEYIMDDTTLVHTRLAIIDLVTGAQPLLNFPLALIANGEIYNYIELKQDLPGGYHTASDCESALTLFAQNSSSYTARLRGMYAIAIHDQRLGTLTLSRDFFGIKPLYIAPCSAGLAFASEPQALLAAGAASRQIEPQKLHELLNLQFTTGRQTIFSGIQRVMPGETLTFQKGEIASRSQLSFPRALPAPRNEEAALAALDTVLEEAVELHQRSDVPYGMFLSGGIDSSIILAMMARLNSAPVLAFTAGFDDNSVADERIAAATTAKAVGAHHEQIHITQKMVWAHLPEIVSSIDDPTADYAIIPSWFLARRAKQDVKVILSGEGGDEFFAGYGRYRSAARFIWPKKIRARGAFDGLDVLRTPLTGWRKGIAAVEKAQMSFSRLTNAQMTDIVDWLPHDLLLKLDRCLMVHSIEGRTPFIDRNVAAFAFSLPENLLVRNGQGKYLLRLWLQKHFPIAQPFAKKQGFDVPIGQWIAAQAKPLAELLIRQPIIAELATPDKVRTLLANADQKRPGFAAWILLFTALWHQRHILNIRVGGDVFETLRQT